ncbi:hypothetical protein J7I80_05815 [Bacillus sp. ISL-41]|uniref:hypothetical protein n=1 Tax=Bacillus sp. ISL-41 TaxID=2819127 RepID=UPI001BE57C4D|nr:hypothetical protein [Bacillus sp. ISL-41]MBT2641732.1 hypothetical protein [Bacillus sp. ISL-41]
MTPEELVEKLNTEKIDVRELSIQYGLAKRTLENRLADFDYRQDASGIWDYVGGSE